MMQRLETRHWTIIAIMVIVVASMQFNVPLESLKEIIIALVTLGSVDFVIKRFKEAKKT